MKYEANAPITLTETNIVFDVNGEQVKMPAKAILRLLPEPGLVIECHDSLTADNLRLQNLSFGDNDYITASILDQKSEFIVGQSSLRIAEDSQIGLALFPKKEPVSIHLRGESLSSVEFGVLNFPKFLGGQDKRIEKDGMKHRVGAVQMEADNWTIEITSESNLPEVKKLLDSQGGYAVTHTGTIKRSDGSSFSVQDVQPLLEGLRLFLSFARGAFCGLTLVVGRNDQGESAWERWGANRTAQWIAPLSWFDLKHGEILSEVFPGFWKFYQEQEELARMVVGLYVSSNLGSHGVGIDGGLILTQAALERFSHQESGKTGERIAAALKGKGISETALSISSDSCPELSMVGSKHNWKHGPHAMVEIRNHIVHPNEKYGDLSSRAYYEAWTLGQWYIELLLLKFSGYSGKYGNRVTQKWRGEVETLGQWLVENMPRGTNLEIPGRREPEPDAPFITGESK